MSEIPIWEKYCLTISETSKIFGIGEKKIRQIISEHPDEEFILEIGTHTKIKRAQFEKYLVSITSL